MGPVNRDLKFRDNKVAEQVSAAASAFAALMCAALRFLNKESDEERGAREWDRRFLSLLSANERSFPARGLEQGGRS